mmetsp:Transcript_36672/g.97100  ORF Transcript_36672/g.97100 Transcript_36672/m.97100 type:complete len:310 (-) Transcript_36672:245-1174(-)
MASSRALSSGSSGSSSGALSGPAAPCSAALRAAASALSWPPSKACFRSAFRAARPSRARRASLARFMSFSRAYTSIAASMAVRSRDASPALMARLVSWTASWRRLSMRMPSLSRTTWSLSGPRPAPTAVCIAACSFHQSSDSMASLNAASARWRAASASSLSRASLALRTSWPCNPSCCASSRAAWSAAGSAPSAASTRRRRTLPRRGVANGAGTALQASSTTKVHRVGASSKRRSTSELHLAELPMWGASAPGRGGLSRRGVAPFRGGLGGRGAARGAGPVWRPASPSLEGLGGRSVQVSVRPKPCGV